MAYLFHFLYLLFASFRLITPGGKHALLAENILLRQQLIAFARHHKRSPALTSSDRILFGFLLPFVNPKRLKKIAILIKPATLIGFHKALVHRMFKKLYSSRVKRKPGPKGPSQELIDTIVSMKQYNPRMGAPQIACQISHCFGIEIDKDVVRRVLATHYRHSPSNNDGPSWLTFLAHSKDSLWSLDFFRCESITLKSYMVMVVMDVFTRRIIGFAVHSYPLDGPAICVMFNQATSRQLKPTYLSTDNDPLFKYHQWIANLDIMGINEIKTVPYVPTSHPYVERLIGTIRREYLDHTLFWSQCDLERKLNTFKDYYNNFRVHSSLDHQTPAEKSELSVHQPANLKNFGWKPHCNDLFHTPIYA